jgi:serine/threonine protein kinase
MSDESQNPPPTLRSLPGRVDKYEIVRALGKGAMGVVYLAHDTVLERDVALKVMVPQIADDKELHERFKREAKAVAKMTHPNVVAVFDLGQLPDGSPYIAMEFLKGQDLHQARRAQPPLSLERKVAIMVQVLAGLAHAHEAGIVHRDIKPANIFLSLDGVAKIMDFGVAHVSTASMTGTGHVVGTADYMSPEQVKGAKVDGRSDVFSVGCMLFELIADVRPFHAETLMAIFYKITHAEPDWDLIPGGDDYDALLPILQKALDKDLEARYQTAYEMAVDLRNYLIAHVTSASGARVLENLLDDGRPTEAGLDAASPTLGTLGISVTRPPLQTTNIGRAGRATERPRSTLIEPAAPTARPEGPATGTALRPRPAAPAGRSIPALTPRRRPAPPSRMPLYAGAALLVVALGAGGYLWIQRQQTIVPPLAAPSPVPAQTPVTSLAETPVPLASVSPAETVEVTPSIAPPVASPIPDATIPTPGASAGKTALAAAQAAFRKGDYALALERAQSALRENPNDVAARKLVDQALLGQQAASHMAEAEVALKAGELDRAQAAADRAREVAPWDSSVTALRTRIAEARTRAGQQAQQQAQAHVVQLLNDADAALQAQKYDDALKLYEEALKTEPSNAAARAGRTTAIGLKSAPAGRGASGRTFVADRTLADAGQRTTGNLPPGFEPDTKVQVQKGTQAGDLPGKIQFEVSPEGVKSGERFTVRIFFFNEGTAPIPVASLSVGTTISGKRTGGAIAPRAKDVAPGQKALLHEFSDLWREDNSSWSMDVVVTTTRGEKYSNKLTSR